MSKRFTITKTWQDFPAAHRQPNHDGHCRWIHGHDWRFDITFGCNELDENNFVIDFGKLELVRDFLRDQFDHTLLLNQDDPFLEHLKQSLSSKGAPAGFEGQGVETVSDFANIKVVPNCGSEGLAKFVFDEVMVMFRGPAFNEAWKRGVFVSSVTVWEDSKNRATYYGN